MPVHLLSCHLQAAGQHCILVTHGNESGQCNLILCDSIGTPVDSNTMMVEPLCLTMTSTHVVAASADTVFVWLYNPVSGAQTVRCIQRNPSTPVTAVGMRIYPKACSLAFGNGGCLLTARLRSQAMPYAGNSSGAEYAGTAKLAQSEATFRIDGAPSPVTFAVSFSAMAYFLLLCNLPCNVLAAPQQAEFAFHGIIGLAAEAVFCGASSSLHNMGYIPRQQLPEVAPRCTAAYRNMLLR